MEDKNYSKRNNKEKDLEGNPQWLLEKYRLLAENSVDCIWTTDKNLVFTYVSPSLERILGFKPEEWIGTSLKPHLNEEEFKDVPKIVDETIRNYENQKPEPIHFETKALNKKNKEVDLEITAKVLLDEEGRFIGFQGATRDISERKRAEEKLRESEAKYRAIFENMPSASCLDEIIYENKKAIDYRILEVNPAYERLHGITREKAIGSLASQLYGTGEAPYLDIYSQVVKTGKPDSFETYFKPIKKYLYITVSTPSPGMISILATDITELKKSENELRKIKDRLQTQVDKQTEELQQRVAELERFHEATIDREFRIKELRDEIKRLKSEK